MSIALGVATKLEKPAVTYQILDAVNKRTLSKAQTQALARLLTENPDMTVRRAVGSVLRGIRRKKGGNGQATGGIDAGMVLATVAKWRMQLDKAHGVGAQETTSETREGLVEQLTEVRKLVEALACAKAPIHIGRRTCLTWARITRSSS